MRFFMEPDPKSKVPLDRFQGIWEKRHEKMAESMICVRCNLPVPTSVVKCDKGHYCCVKCYSSWLTDTITDMAGLREAEQGSKFSDKDPLKLGLCCVESCVQPPRNDTLKLQGILENCKCECLFSDLGCKKTLTPEEWMDHVKECLFHPQQSIRCVFESCTKRMPAQVTGPELDEHYILDHNVVRLAFRKCDGDLGTMKFSLDPGRLSAKMVLMEEPDTEKYIMLCSEVSNGCVYLWAWEILQGRSYWRQKRDSGNEYYRITIIPKTETTVDGAVSFMGKFQSVNRTAGDIMESGDCMVIPVNQVEKKYMKVQERPDGAYRFFVVTIKIIREEIVNPQKQILLD